MVREHEWLPPVDIGMQPEGEQLQEGSPCEALGVVVPKGGAALGLEWGSGEEHAL